MGLIEGKHIIVLLKGKYQSLSLPVKSMLYFTLCAVLLKSIGFLSSFVFTRVIPQAEYGMLSVFVSCQQIFLIFATGEIQLGAYTRGLFKYQDNEKLFTTSMQGLVNLLTIISFCGVFVFSDFIMSFTNMNQWNLMSLFGYLLFEPAYQGWMTRRRMVYDYKPVVTVTIINALGTFLVPLISVFIFGRTANVQFLSMLAVSSCIAFMFWVKYANYFDLLKEKERVFLYWKFMIRYEGPLVLHSLSYFLLNQSDRIMISKMVGNEQAALYGIAYSVAIVITFIQSSLDQVLAPWRYHQLKEGKYNNIRWVSNVILLFYSGIVLVFILLAPDVIGYLFPDSYYDGIWCIPPLTGSVFFIFLYSMFVGVETYYEQTQYVLYVSLICGIVNIVLNYYSIPIFGYIACAYTTLISYILFAVGHYFFMRRALREREIPSAVYDGHSILFISFGVLAVSVVSNIVYANVFLRYLLLLFIGIWIFVSRAFLSRMVQIFNKKMK